MHMGLSPLHFASCQLSPLSRFYGIVDLSLQVSLTDLASRKHRSLTELGLIANLGFLRKTWSSHRPWFSWQNLEHTISFSKCSSDLQKVST